MSEFTPLAILLHRYMTERAYSLERLANESSVSKQTLHNWLKKEGIRRPHTWQPVVKVALALKLNKGQVTALLEAAGHPSIDHLSSDAMNPADSSLLVRWSTTPPHNLPSDVTNFIGRADELSWITKLLGRSRLVTLSGPGGSGKTRLALQVARSLLERYLDGVFFVDLVTITDPVLVLPTVGQTLGLSSTTSEPVQERLKNYLRQRRMLLVLDNFEHVIMAGPQIVALLKAAPNLTVLITSREVLHVSGEHEFPVPPLPLPVVNEPFDGLSQNTAITLFVERAQAVNISFTLTSNNIKQVAEICRWLDGLPLAIELAAARSKEFTPEELLTSFNSRLVLASTGPQDVPLRHRSLHSLIDWSYQLLKNDEQIVFRRLAVFVGGWTHEAAIHVINAAADLSVDVMACLRELEQKNLVFLVTATNGQPRFGMLATIREYGYEQLVAGGELDELQQHHASYFAHLAEVAAKVMLGPEQRIWTERVQSEHSNIRAALEAAIARRNTEVAQRIAAALAPFWSRRPYVTEGRRWVAQILEMSNSAPPQLKAAVLKGGAMMAHSQNDYATSTALYTEVLALYRQANDPVGEAETIGRLGMVAQSQHDYQQSAELFGQSLKLYRQIADKHGMAWMLDQLAYTTLSRGNPQAALQLGQESLSVAQEQGEQGQLASSLAVNGLINFFLGNYQPAVEYHQHSLHLFKALDDAWGVSSALNNWGYAALFQGDLEQATRLFKESLTLQRELGDHHLIRYALDGLAAVALSRGQAIQAVRLAGQAAALREAMHVQIPMSEQAHYDRLLASARAQLDAEMWNRAWSDGQSLTVEQAITEALEKV